MRCPFLFGDGAAGCIFVWVLTEVYPCRWCQLLDMQVQNTNHGLMPLHVEPIPVEHGEHPDTLNPIYRSGRHIEPELSAVSGMMRWNHHRKIRSSPYWGNRSQHFLCVHCDPSSFPGRSVRSKDSGAKNLEIAIVGTRVERWNLRPASGLTQRCCGGL